MIFDYTYTATTGNVEVRNVVFGFDKLNGKVTAEFELRAVEVTASANEVTAKLEYSSAVKSTLDIDSPPDRWARQKISWTASDELNLSDYGSQIITLKIYDEDDVLCHTSTGSIDLDLDPIEFECTITSHSLGADSTPDITFKLDDLNSEQSLVPIVTVGGVNSSGCTIYLDDGDGTTTETILSTESIDQDQYNAWGHTEVSPLIIWQSFTAVGGFGSGEITGFSFVNVNLAEYTHTFTIKLYSGTGASGSILATGSVTVTPNHYEWVNIPFSSPYDLVEGDVYTIHIDTDQPGFGYAYNSAVGTLDGGQFSGNEYYDLAFKLHRRDRLGCLNGIKFSESSLAMDSTVSKYTYFKRIDSYKITAPAMASGLNNYTINLQANAV